MRKRGLAIGTVIGTLVGVFWASTVGPIDGRAAAVFVALGVGAGALVGAFAAPLIALIRKLQGLADLPEKSKTVPREEGAAECDQHP